MAENIAEIADHPSRAFKVQTTVLREHTRDTSIKLKSGEHLFVVVDGRPPIDSGHSGPDEICIVSEQFGTWPVVAVRVRAAHVDQWRALSEADAGRMMSRVRDSVRAHLQKDPG